ncbi:MAG: pyridoxal phosphate-dependent aminotransferase [Aeriscardovia sp.]|nr:pyridoxal phosphate-dependent aminotransferase [Aeriscardovia sp.]
METSGRGTPRFSHRVPVGEPNPIIAAQDAAKTVGHSLYQLNDSNPTHHGLTLKDMPLCYDAEPRGQGFARQALAEFLTHRARNQGFDLPVPACVPTPHGAAASMVSMLASESIDSDDLYLVSSTSEAYSWLMKLLCDPGEAVLCPTPGYPLIPSISALESVKAVPYPLRYDGSWYIDVDWIARILKERDDIRALILINPNNPTGSYAGRDDYERLVELCAEHRLAVIADEVFFDFALEPTHVPFRVAGEKRVLTFGLDGFSKLLAAPHAKIGWIQMSGPDEAMAEAKKRLDVISDDYLPMSSILAERLPSLLERVPDQLRRTRERTVGNLRILKDLLACSRSGVTTLLRPEGGWNVLLRFPGSLDENELVDAMIHEQGMTAQPGYFFDMPTNGYVCASLLPRPADFRKGISALLDVVDGFFE